MTPKPAPGPSVPDFILDSDEGEGDEDGSNGNEDGSDGDEDNEDSGNEKSPGEEGAGGVVAKKSSSRSHVWLRT